MLDGVPQATFADRVEGRGERKDGALGVVAGVTALDAAKAGPVPPALTAATLNV